MRRAVACQWTDDSVFRRAGRRLLAAGWHGFSPGGRRVSLGFLPSYKFTSVAFSGPLIRHIPLYRSRKSQSGQQALRVGLWCERRV